MQDIMLYFIRGINHYIFLLYEMFDFKELATILFLLLFFSVVFIFNKNIRKQVVELTLSIFDLVRTKVGMIFFSILLLYYIYIAYAFEESINTLVLLTSLYLFIESFIKTNLNLTSDSDNSVFEWILEFSIPVIILALQQIVIIIENGRFNNFLAILLSLLIIPIYSIVFVLLKNFICFDAFYNRNQINGHFNKYEFYKTYTQAVFIFLNYKDAETYLQELLNSTQNNVINSKQLSTRIAKININFDFKPKFQTIKRQSKSKIFKLFNYLWIINIVYILFRICKFRYFKISFGFTYYWTLGILIIYLNFDLMKIQKIQNQYDFVLYLFFNIFFTSIIVTYALTLKQFRLTEIAFIIPFFIVARVIASFYDPINFLGLPFLSKKNYFGVDPSKCDVKRNKI